MTFSEPDLRETREDFILHACRKIARVLVGTQVLERQNGDRDLAAHRRRRMRRDAWTQVRYPRSAATMRTTTPNDRYIAVCVMRPAVAGAVF